MKRRWLLIRLFLFLVFGGARAWVRQTALNLIEKGRGERFLLTRAGEWSRQAVIKAGAKVEVVGLEKIPEQGPVLYVANHQGTLDIPILMGYLPGSPAFVAKQELFNIPILGFWMRRIGCIAINRDSPREARKAIMTAAEQVRDGRRIVLFPEGTRSRDPGGKMGPFRRGSLKLAAAAGAVVVPVTVEGSRFLLTDGNHQGFDGVVKVFIGDPIAVSELDSDAQKQLPEQVHQVIESTLLANHMGVMDAAQVKV